MVAITISFSDFRRTQLLGLDQLKNRRFHLIQQLERVGARLIGFGDALGHGADQVAQNGLLSHHLCMPIDIGGRGETRRELGQVFDATGLVKIATVLQRIFECEDINRCAFRE